MRIYAACVYLSIFFCIGISSSLPLYALEPSTAETDFHNESKSFDFHNMMSMYQPNYFLAFYHNKIPDHRMYKGRTPSNASVDQNESKVQFSVYFPILRSFFGFDDLRLYFAYTQLFFWQIYNKKTAFIREVNYEPMIWLRYHFAENMFANLVLDHQSNGKGGYMEVSWNRVIGYVEFTSEHWYTQFAVWYPFWLLKANDHNPKALTHFLGYDKIVLSYDWKSVVFSVELENLESALTRGHVMASISYSAKYPLKLYLQYFYGYGQSLIEYDHLTQGYGIGIAISDWQ